MTSPFEENFRIDHFPESSLEIIKQKEFDKEKPALELEPGKKEVRNDQGRSRQTN